MQGACPWFTPNRGPSLRDTLQAGGHTQVGSAGGLGSVGSLSISSGSIGSARSSGGTGGGPPYSAAGPGQPLSVDIAAPTSNAPMRAAVRLGAEIAASQNGQTTASMRTWREQTEQV